MIMGRRVRRRVCYLLAGVAILAPLGCGESGSTSNGPAPKAQVDEPQVDFGKAAVGTTVVHEFRISNEGKTDLILGAPEAWDEETGCDVTCELSAQTVPPGETIIARLTVTPRNVAPGKYQGVYIPTNEGPDSRIRIGGALKIENVVQLLPRDPVEDFWKLTSDSTGEVEPFVASVHSTSREQFRIVEILTEPSSLAVEATPLQPEKLAELQAKSGYQLLLTVPESREAGRSPGRVTVRTDVADAPDQSMPLVFLRTGPVVHVAATNGRWLSGRFLLDMGHFPSSQGMSATIDIVLDVSGIPSCAWQGVETTHSNLRVTLDALPERSNDRRSWAKLGIHVDPGGPRTARRKDDPAEIRIRTSHPRAEEIVLSVAYVAD